MRKTLVIGGQGLLGRAVVRELERALVPFIVTTRRSRMQCENLRFLDLEEPDRMCVDDTFSEVYLCAGIARIEDCDKDPVSTSRINVTNTLSFARSLIHAGAFVVFPSSSTVFDGSRPFPGEDQTAAPANEYGRQKATVEKELLALKAQAPAGAAVVRITKVVSASSALFRDWLDAIRSGKFCTAYSDVTFSPVSAAYAARLLLAVGQRKEGGIYHCSGAADISYFEFVKRLCLAAGKPLDIVTPIQAPGGPAIFRPAHAALGMDATTRYLGIAPQPLEAVIEDLWREYRVS